MPFGLCLSHPAGSCRPGCVHWSTRSWAKFRAEPPAQQRLVWQWMRFSAIAGECPIGCAPAPARRPTPRQDRLARRRISTGSELIRVVERSSGTMLEVDSACLHPMHSNQPWLLQRRRPDRRNDCECDWIESLLCGFVDLFAARAAKHLATLQRRSLRRSSGRFMHSPSCGRRAAHCGIFV